MAPKKRGHPRKRNDNEDHDFIPDNSSKSFVATSTDAQATSDQRGDANLNQGSIYEAVSRRRSDQLAKSLLADGASTNTAFNEATDSDADEPDKFKHDEPKTDSYKFKAIKQESSLRPLGLGPPTLTDTWVPPQHYQLPKTIDYNKPRHEIVAEKEAATGVSYDSDSEEAQASLHVQHLFSVPCPLPSLHGASIPTERWLAEPYETLTKGLQEAAVAAADKPALSDQELFSDFVAMGMYDRDMQQFGFTRKTTRAAARNASAAGASSGAAAASVVGSASAHGGAASGVVAASEEGEGNVPLL